MSIKVITKAEILADVPDRWAEQYRHYPQNDPKQDITRQLQALKGADYSAEQINRIIGNPSWTALECDECGNDSDFLIRVGDEPDYEARWVDLCRDCIGKLVEASDA